MNCKIHPILYKFYLRLNETLGAEMVHRRKRTSRMCIEVIFYNDICVPIGRLNTLPEAEKCGFWVICRQQTKPKYMFYKDHEVYQLFLSPVHPKKRREMNPVIIPLREVAAIAMTA